MAAGWPLLGSSAALLRNPLAFLRREYARLGPVFDVRAAQRTFTVLAGTEANRFIAVEGRELLAAEPFWGQLAEAHQCPHMLIALDGVPHAKLRGLYHDDLSRRIVAEQADAVAALTLAELARAAAPDGVIPARDFTRLLVSRQVHHLLTRGAEPIDEDTARALMEMFRWDTNTLLLGKWPRLALRAPTYRRHVRRAYAFLNALIRDTDHTMPDGWFGTTHRARRALPELFGAGDLRVAFLLPFVAGVDTVGSTLAYMLYEVLRDRALHERVTSAIDACYQAAGDETPSVAALRAIPELNGLVLETLRLHPAAFGVYRRATAAFELAGKRVPAGRDVLVFTTSPHTDPRHYPDPYRFDIDRFAPPRSEHKQRYAFAPYGGGPHVCLGAGMGDALLTLAAATLLRHADLVATAPGARYRPTFDPSLAISGKFKIRYRGPRALPCGSSPSHRAARSEPCSGNPRPA